MNKSIKFISTLIKEGRFGNGFPHDRSSAGPASFLEVLLRIYPQMQDVLKDNLVSYKLTADGDKARKITIKYEPDADFEWATSKMSYNDGTLLFPFQLHEEILNRVLQGTLYYRLTVPTGYEDNMWDYNIEYSVGDMCWLSEHGDWGIEDKPWMRQKDSVCLPLSIKYIRRGEIT